MKFLVVSKRGEGLPFALQLQQEGHAVKFFSTSEPLVGSGLVPTVQALNGTSIFGQIRRETEKDAIILFTSGDFGPIAGLLKKEGYLTFGASLFHDSLQNNPSYRNSMNQLHGIQEVPAQMIMGFALEAWFNGEDFMYPIFGMIPEYGLMAGELGPGIECAGVSGFGFKNFRPAKFRSTLEKLHSTLRKADYRGPISVDVMGEAVLRYVCGFRFDFAYLMLGLLSGDQEFGHLIADTVRGMSKQVRTRQDYGVCIRASFPPYPHAMCPPQNLAIAGKKDIEDGLVPTGLCAVPGREELFLVSTTGEAFCVCGFGATIKDAQGNAYLKIAKFMSPNIQFRVDIGAVALKHIGQLLQSDYQKEESRDGIPSGHAKG